MIRKIVIGLVIVLVIIQFIRPAKNLSGDTSKDISIGYAVPDDIQAIFKRSCNDCHSNQTVYPWYAEVQPVGWWLNHHVEDGKRHLNLNNFTSMRIAFQKKKLEEIMEQVKKDEMPMSSYLWIHTNAKLSDPDKQALNAWCQQQIDSIKAKYPADSLVLPKRRRD